MQFDQLNSDVLLDILAFTDVSTILSLSQIATSKQLWISAASCLSSRRLIYLPSDVNLEFFSTLALVDEVKGTVVGPRT
ncbi:hypothetical protein B0H19DRAFT_1257816 [Mycena capillaripes]|nr:hypothetical protein B0H19DRAFT_1257816 [Mycena capillaripes]